MKTLSIKGIKRENVGKSFSKKLRKDGNIPCVIYGGKENIHFSTHKNNFLKLVYTPNVYKVELDIDGGKLNAIMQDIQFHPLTDEITHVDFIELMPGKKVTMETPVKLIGNPIGVRNGGNLRLNLRKLLVRAMPENLIENIELNIEHLRIGDKIRVSEIENENIELLNQKHDVVVAVKRARVIVEEEEEEEEEGAEGAEGAEGTEGAEGADKKDDAAKENVDSKEEAKKE